MTPEDWKMQTGSPIFAFTKDPDIKEVKYLTAIIKTSDGKVFTVNFQYDFKKGHL